MTLTLRYFAWVRERGGETSETVVSDAATVADLVEELRGREERYARAFTDLRGVRVAVDQELAELKAHFGAG